MIKQSPKKRILLMADDDADDRILVKEALEECQFHGDFLCVEDGEELMDALHHRGKYAQQSPSPPPDLILLDLNMPRKNGREALAEIRSTPFLQHIPIVMLTTSAGESDISRAYHLGANSYIVKPATFEALLEMMKTLLRYWFETVLLPSNAP